MEKFNLAMVDEKYEENNVSSLKSGMFIRLRNGVYNIVLNVGGELVYSRDSDFYNISENYNELLLNKHTKNLDIMEILVPTKPLTLQQYFKGNGIKEIWHREEIKEVTMKEIAEKFGVDVINLRIKN